MDLPKEQVAETIVEPWQETEVIMGNLLLIESYSRNVGRCAVLPLRIAFLSPPQCQAQTSAIHLWSLVMIASAPEILQITVMAV